MDLEKVKDIFNWPRPQSTFEVISFHGLASFYRKFIRNFSGICAPIVETIKKENQPYQIKAAKEGFQLLKKKITKQPVLTLPDFNKVYQVKCDASGIAIGAVLSQEEKPITCYSEKIE